jgi:hypothetical protein
MRITTEFLSHAGISVDLSNGKPAPPYHECLRVDAGVYRPRRIHNHVAPRRQSYPEPAVLVGFGPGDFFFARYSLNHQRALVGSLRARSIRSFRPWTSGTEEYHAFDPARA